MIEAGRDRFAARGGDTWGWSVATWHREPMALLRLEMTLADDSHTHIQTDNSWHAAAGPVVEKFFQGERWIVDGGAPEWRPATVVAAPAGELRRATHPAPERMASIAPVTASPQGAGRTVYDFGDVITGRLTCQAVGGPGAAVEVVSGEQRAADGSVICDNVLVAGPGQRDSLHFAAAHEQFNWEARF